MRHPGRLQPGLTKQMEDAAAGVTAGRLDRHVVTTAKRVVGRKVQDQKAVRPQNSMQVVKRQNRIAEEHHSEA